MKYKNFEELPIWQKAREIVNLVYFITRKYPNLSNDRRLVDQLHGASISIMNNCAEGFDSDNSTEFARFLRYSQRSTSEIMSMTYVLKDNYPEIIESGDLYEMCLDERKQIKGFIKYLKSFKKKNP